MNNSVDTTRFMRKVIKVRKYLISKNKSFKDQKLMLELIQKFEKQLSFWGKVGVGYIKKHSTEIAALIPTNQSGDAMLDELHKICAL